MAGLFCLVETPHGGYFIDLETPPQGNRAPNLRELVKLLGPRLCPADCPQRLPGLQSGPA
jgi:hypothetical protein